MRQFLQKLTKGPATPTQSPHTDVAPAVPAPDRPLYVVGDIHGHLDALEDLLRLIDADVPARGARNPVLVFVGDLVDRGEHSAAVLARVQTMCTNLPDNLVCLMGNHERMMLDFLEDPAGRGPRWLRNGGLQTLASFGVRGATQQLPEAELHRLARDLRAAMPKGQEAWLRALPLRWQSGNVLCVHAAADPERAPDDQSEKTLIWGSRAFMDQPRHDGICVVHGHTVVDTPERHATRIAVDTGAYYTGRLTAAVLMAGQEPAFLGSGAH